ncbi:hypothetical protein DRN67_04130 [Candidatus Micrarchaeota archaeon]|nr:MAG: hypothetical protein DRN67_04130 [Candidatus Micrarchaeota archaeon]
MLLLVPLSASRIYCTEDRPFDPSNPDCVYDVPGGEAVIGPGKEVLQTIEESFDDEVLSVKRKLIIVRTGSISYRIQGTAELYKETIVEYEVTNKDDEGVMDVEIEQGVGKGETHSVYVGKLEPGESKIVSFVIADERTEIGEPLIDYTLPTVALRASNVVIGEEITVWLSINSEPLAGEMVEVITPAGYKFDLKTDEEGKASFVSREVGAYVFNVPHRHMSTPTYIYAVNEEVQPSDEEEEEQNASPGTAAFLVGTVSEGAGKIVGMMGPLGIVVLVLLIGLSGWTYIKMRKPEVEEEIVIDEEVPRELAPYREEAEDKEEDDSMITTDIDELVRLVREKGRVEVREAANILGVSPLEVEVWARALEEDNAIEVDYNLTRIYLVWKGKSEKLNGMLTEDQKRKLLESTIVQAPKKMAELESKPKPSKAKPSKKAKKKGRASKKKAGKKTSKRRKK